ncbi:BglII/BstYI family type II restriction endonuclease [Bradyrhizobium sp. B120]|uniref:BglII/BstYI family type II restriction endonuclease n=1 Tax=Bradyrhizobium sp. B120 TaxID=3410088 RepID=UPI003B983564
MSSGVLSTACPKEWRELQEVLRQFKLLKSEVRIAGGNRSLISRRIDEPLYAKGWVEKEFKTSIIVDENKIDSPTHAVDCFKGGVAVEMEWNNKRDRFSRTTFAFDHTSLPTYLNGNCFGGALWLGRHGNGDLFPNERQPLPFRDDQPSERSE